MAHGNKPKANLSSALESRLSPDTNSIADNNTADAIMASDNEANAQQPPSVPAPKGFMRLPAEIRLQIYEDYFIPPPGLITGCHYHKSTCRLTPQNISVDLANTAHTTTISARRSYHCKCDHCAFSGALLLTNHQIRSEAAPILESTFQFTLNIQLGWWQLTYAKFDVEMAGLWGLDLGNMNGIPSYIKTFVLHLDFFEPEDIIELDKVHAVAKDLAFLHHLADQVEFVVEVHIALAFEEKALGWSEAVSEKSKGSEHFVAYWEMTAPSMRHKLIAGLKKQFLKKGKEFRLLDEK
ncbi:hypothetical protein CERZMDRAFT_98891 [Cercospora zeae-maydis SCOH1-5]|uniref:2EXR domain-containing protein n=1 Tax=Cercospora zeae-maydis SCOH1-5 TaxID=717836 RepID=A0A6A6FCI4_9PEZI|nr:hypothetical protein CERZMDRAFT_98891 [Cercospora zeae-maydis SCOH1-5]